MKVASGGTSAESYSREDSPFPKEFTLSAVERRQLDSIVWAYAGPLTGSGRRDEVFASPADAARLGLANGDAIDLRSETFGTFRGVARIDDEHPGTPQAYWPETNHQIANRRDPASRELDYDAVVTLERA